MRTRKLLSLCKYCPITAKPYRTCLQVSAIGFEITDIQITIRKAPLSVCAAECEVISTSPTAVFSKYSLFSLFTRTQRGMYLLLSAHPSPVAADSQAAVGFNSDMPTPQAPIRVGFGSRSHGISPQECQEQQKSWFRPHRYCLTSKAWCFFCAAPLAELRQLLSRIAGSSPELLFWGLRGCHRNTQQPGLGGTAGGQLVHPDTQSKECPSIFNQAGKASYQYQACFL